MAGTLLLNLYGFRQAVTTIRQRYFDGEEIMFSDTVKSLADLTKYTEELITEFNGHVAKQTEDKLDMEVLRTVADRTVSGGFHILWIWPKLRPWMPWVKIGLLSN